MNSELGPLESPALSVSGDKLLLSNEECAAGGRPGGHLSRLGTKFYDNVYRWRLSGGTLRITTVKNSCPDKVAETILTSQPWRKAG